MLSRNDVTQLLVEWGKGDKAALDQLTPILYDELRRLADSYLRRERDDHTLQPTALVHEAYVKLADQTKLEWQNRAHFFGIAAQVMRHILVDHSRKHNAEKRGAGMPKVPIEEGLMVSKQQSSDIVALDDALKALSVIDERKSKIIELRYFGGLTVEEMAEVLGISVATIGRELRMAQAWLHREMTAPPASSSPSKS
ncbi:MAG TPA: sigma-70 family RNA polymerase sigma factor [Bryobacteraceae bacterium]|jgi:RNA polymerase sigma factor (TIGR02999 family)|nr:sigma-70 family RNA polymerase sigma factor [Bryobacteraceae bacterium]